MKHSHQRKIAFVILLLGIMSGVYFIIMGPEHEPEKACGSSCEHPAQLAPLICHSSSDCETRGKDEWESCEHRDAPRNTEQQAQPSRDQTSKTQEGYSCLCVESQCAYHKP